jgi:hypothetical protein
VYFGIGGVAKLIGDSCLVLEASADPPRRALSFSRRLSWGKPERAMGARAFALVNAQTAKSLTNKV